MIHILVNVVVFAGAKLSFLRIFTSEYKRHAQIAADRIRDVDRLNPRRGSRRSRRARLSATQTLKTRRGVGNFFGYLHIFLSPEKFVDG
jgi:hypothetical protein